MERHEVPQPVDVTVESRCGNWPGKTNDLSPRGATVTSRESISLALRSVVMVRVPLPDGEPPLSIPARVVEASTVGTSLSFFNVGNRQTQRLKDFLSLNSEADIPTRSSLPPEVESTRPAERGVGSNGGGNGKPEVIEVSHPEEPQEVPVPPTDVLRVQELLRQVGVDSLCPPSNGVLSAQWRSFLEQLGSTPTGTISSRSGMSGAPSVPRIGGNRSLTPRQ